MIRKCTKPGLPVLLYIALTLWASCACIYYFIKDIEDLSVVKLISLVAFCVAIVCVLCLVVFRRFKVVVVILIAALIGCSLGSLGSADVRGKANLVSEPEQELLVTLSADAKVSTLGKSATCSILLQNGKRLNATCYFNEDVDLLTSETIKVKSKLKSLSTNSSEYAYFQGVSASLTVKDFEVVRDNFAINTIVDLRRSTIHNFEAFGGSQSGILQALVCGYRNTIQASGNYEKYKICGLAHMVAVSGAHLGIVVMLLMQLLKLVKASKKLNIIVCSIFVVFYCIFAGIPISAVRAAIMVVLSLFSYFGRRSAAPLNALAICIIAFITLDPVTSVSVSLFLSTASTFSILVFSRLIESWFERAPEWVKNLVVAPVALTTSANIATLPFSAALFSQLSTIALVSNILVTPFFGFACSSGVALAVLSLLLPRLTGIFVCIAKVITYPLTSIIDFLSAVPYASIAVSLDVIEMLILSVVIIVVLYLWWPKLRLKQALVGVGGIAIIFACFISVSPVFESDEIVMLDIGQGDSILFKSGGKHFLIDTGTNDSELREEIAKNSIHRLDGVLITHHDDDHMGSLTSLASYCEIGDVFISSQAFICGCKNCEAMITDVDSVSKSGGVHGVSVGDRIGVGKFNLCVISPDTFSDEGGNADSIVLKCERAGGEFVALFGGDAEAETLSQLVKEQKIGDIDILKVSHHGSKKSVDADVLKTLKPEVSLISVGAKNRYGHPSNECLTYLKDANSKVFRTDTQGEITVSFRGDNYSVVAEK